MGSMAMNNRNGGSNNNRIWKILLALCLVAALAAGIGWGVHLYGQNRAEQQMRDLADLTNPSGQTEPASAPESSETPEEPVEKDPLALLEEMGVPIPDKEVDFEQLQAEVNADIYAWIYIPDSLIDYPVLQHPTDNLYYLEHNLDGSKGYPGCIYSEDYNAKDFSDPNTVLYGHNMKAGTMFAGLHKYEDADYFAEHPYVYIYTPEKLYVYEIFAAYEFSDLHLLLNFDFTSEDVFQKFLDDIYDMRSMTCNINEDVEVTAQNRILTLSTCVKNKSHNRYLVQGVLLNED
ncbi:MAG: class B sortase [Bacteroides sp.]|nr:class B sortase [Bacteroides sp.]